MNKINVMPEVLANKIAAGEVVERIANVIKELVENSIDAGSKNIKIELLSAGTSKIKVVDDGCGMSREDALLCFGRHATSKIKDENDLYYINTLGFRGEALAAISSVSNVVLDTYDEQDATKVNIEYGKVISSGAGSLRKGCSIEVSKLFYNTPARLKFMKSQASELSLTTLYVEKIALSHPNISFTLINDSKDVIKTSGSGDLYKTIHEIFGYNTTKNMIKLSCENYDYTINGYISNINIQKSNKNGMICLVNGRVVSNQSVNKSIKDAYHTVLAENKYPIVVINIETDPTLVDVNIHPTKQDIKFSKLDSLTTLLYDEIKKILYNHDNTFKAYQEEKPIIIENNIYSDSFEEVENEKVVKEEKEEVIPKEKRVIEELRASFNVGEESIIYNEEEKEEKSILIKPVGLALGTYLIAHDEGVMYMIDIHAANERINYEKYLKALKEEKIYVTPMLIPLNLEYAHNEYLNIKEALDNIKSLGFEVEEFGINTLRVSAHPTWLKEGYENESIKRIFELAGSMGSSFDRVKFNERTAMNLACKMSVKANTNIGYAEQEELLNRLFKCEFPYTCPHGRPTIIKYPIYELEKLFKRVN